MHRLLFLALVLVTACAPELEPVRDAHPHQGALDAPREVQDHTPEAFGILAFLNDPATTEAVLDLEVPLDKRAAQSIIAHRNGPDGIYGTADDAPFQSIEEVEDCYWVGPVAIARLVAHAESWGYVPVADEWIGAWEGVDFTFEESVWTLDLVNTASYAHLDDHLDKRAVDAIFENRPILTLDALSATYWVGPATMARLRSLALEAHAPLPGPYESCDELFGCAEGLVCMGSTLWGWGWCESEDLAGTFYGPGVGEIPDGDGEGVVSQVEVSGLASVPVDIVVTLDIDHADRGQLLVTLIDPNGDESPLWVYESDATDVVYANQGITRDDRVNGTWTLHVADLETGTVGTLEGWELFIVSRWD